VASEPSHNNLWLLSCLIAWLAMGGVLSIALYQRANAPLLVEEPPRIAEPADSSPIETRLDPNIAEWYDLTRLPRVGEGLARSIIAYREAKNLEWQSSHPEQSAEQAPPVFTRPEDLLPIKGIGPKTVERLRPFLRFRDGAPASQVSS
jgi:hypothetical protein